MLNFSGDPQPLKLLLLTLESDRPGEEDATELRGLFGTRFTAYALLAAVHLADPLHDRQSRAGPSLL